MINLKSRLNQFLIRAKFQIWGHKAVTKENKEIWDLYRQEQFHAKLMAETLAYLDRLPKHDPNAKPEWYEQSWFIGTIKTDWQDAKTKEKENDNAVD